MKITAQLSHEKVRFDQPNPVHLVLTLTAPAHGAAATRPPVCVVPVIDVSGSMEGEKLHYARQSAMKLVDHLGPGDRCGVVVFSTEAVTLAPPAAMTPDAKEALKASIGELQPLHNTNLGGGMLEALEQVHAAALPEGMIVRVILFTDGLANAGPATTREALLDLLQANLGRATLSAFGYGDDADQELLRDLSTSGRGNYAYVQSPEDALTAFARELGGLLSTHAQQVELLVSPRPGLELTDVVSDVDADALGGTVRIRIPELLAEEVRSVVLAGRLAPRPAPGASPEPVADVTAGWETIEQGLRVIRNEQLQASVRFVAAAEAQQRPTAEVDAVVALAELVRAQIEAEEAARRGDFDRARDVMDTFAQRAIARGHPAVARSASRIAERVSDAGAFASSTAYRSSMRKGATRRVGTLYQREAVTDLAAMGQSTRTAAQERMEEAFGAKRERAARERAAHERTRGAPGPRLSRRRSSRW